MLLPRAPDNRTLLVYGGLAALVIGALYLVVKKAPAAASAVGYSVGSLAPAAAGGLVLGVGSGFGLPNTADPVVVSKGRDALRSGDWLTASLNLPAPEFLSAVWAKLTGRTTNVAQSTAADPTSSQQYVVPAGNTTLDNSSPTFGGGALSGAGPLSGTQLTAKWFGGYT
jgi:hypothetical protein